MTQFESWPQDDKYTIDLLCGGTPCQSFSVAGLRAGLDDPRGDLMLTFGAIAAKYRPRWLVWENVPGVLSSSGGRDFAEFLGLISGQVVDVPKEGWGNSGIVSGYKNAYGLAYRVLDAQYFGVAQRRRRVFVVGCLGDWRRAAAVLFERQSLSGDSAPRRGEGKDVASTITAGAFSGGAGGRPDGAAGNHFIPCVASGKSTIGTSMATIISRGPHAVMTLAHGQGGAEIGFDRAPALTCNHEAVILAFDTQNMTEGHNSGGKGFGECGSPSFTLTKGHSHAVAYALAGNTIGRQPENGGNGEGWSKELAYTLTKADLHGVVVPSMVSNGDAHSGFRDAGGLVCTPIAWSEELTPSVDCASTMQRGGQGGRKEGVMTADMQVRRLTPTECERLQGFPDGYTNVPHRGKPAADGPRYKALGNSWAVPCARWIGERIEMVEGIGA